MNTSTVVDDAGAGQFEKLATRHERPSRAGGRARSLTETVASMAGGVILPRAKPRDPLGFRHAAENLHDIGCRARSMRAARVWLASRWAGEPKRLSQWRFVLARAEVAFEQQRARAGLLQLARNAEQYGEARVTQATRLRGIGSSEHVEQWLLDD